MSTGKFNEAATQGNTADIAIARSESTAKRKFTAADIATDCPARLQRIGEEITKRFLQAQEQAKVLDDQVSELEKLIAEAKDLCEAAVLMPFGRDFSRTCANLASTSCSRSGTIGNQSKKLGPALARAWQSTERLKPRRQIPLQ